MPADARSLLRAAAASSSAHTSAEGIKDRFASYNHKTRALRCLACNYLVIKHESLWASHAASKSHRVNVAQIRKSEEEEEEEEEKRRGLAAEGERDTDAAGGKRKGQHGERGDEDEAAKRTKKSESRQRDKEDGVGGEGPRLDGEAPVDAEWERFQREVLDAPSLADQQPPLTTYADATIEVAPELRGDQEDEEEGEEEEAPRAVESEAELKARLEREEREEILARFEEEQRVQDEADERVTALKNRLQRLKQARMARKG